MADDKAGTYQDIIARAKQQGEAKPPERVAPMKLIGEEKPQRALSPETLEGLAAMGQKVAQRPAPPAATAPDSPPPITPPTPAAAPPDDSFSYLEMLRRSEMESVRKRRKAIEEKLPPLKIEDLILNDEVTQVVQLMPGVEVEFRSISGDEDIAIKRLISLEDERLSDLYIQSKLSMFVLTAAIVRINERLLPVHMDEGESGRKFNEKTFLEKYNRILRRPAAFLSELAMQNNWFQQRLQNLFSGEQVKNG